MNVHIRTIGILLFAITLGLSSCKKYEEGPGFSMRSKKARLVGEWQLDELKIEGEDLTSQINKWELEFEKNEDFDQSFQVVGGQSSTTDGEWEFSNDKEELEVTYDDGTKIDLEIMRLTNKEFFFEFTQRYEDGTSEKWECKFESQ